MTNCECGCDQPVSIAKRTDVRWGHVKGQPKRFINGHQGRKGPNRFEHRPDGTTVLFLIYKGEQKECIIWTRDYEKVKIHHWYGQWNPESKTLYAYAGVCQPDDTHQLLIMARLLVPDCDTVDHKNHNGLDNRVYDELFDIGNIRPASFAQNTWNRRSRPHTSVFNGVSWFKRTKTWIATITVDYKQIYLGGFDSELEASFAYQEAAKKYFGEFACLNFGLEPAVAA
jgi:hypothetical protein